MACRGVEPHRVRTGEPGSSSGHTLRAVHWPLYRPPADISVDISVEPYKVWSGEPQ